MLSKKQIKYMVLKRTIDIFGSLFGIALLSPLLLIVTIVTAITSHGGPFFVQKRLGRNEEVFKLTKFRSMKANAAQIPPEDMTIAQQQAMVTKWGHFIRKTSIDEIPQLFNILKGDMSFIGPRPSQTKEYENELVMARESFIPTAYEVKPGLSGYAQIRMKRSHEIEEKAREDSYYVRHMSFWLDTKIFFYSFFMAFGIVKGR